MYKLMMYWVALFIIGYITQILIQMFLNSDGNLSNFDGFLEFLAWLSTVVGTILFIIWLTKYNNKNILKMIWIISLSILIGSTAIVILFSNDSSDNNKKLIIPSYLIGYSFTIFIGSFITFMIKK